MAYGLATDAAVGAVLGGGGYALVRGLGSNAFKLRAVGQSITAFKAARIPGSAWLLDKFARGLRIEQTVLGRAASFLGQKIPGYRVIDDYIMHGGKGIATSVKNMDLTMDTYKTASGILSKIRGDARALQQFTGRLTPKFSCGPGSDNPINEKILLYVFEVGAANSVQAKAITTFLREAPSKFPGIKVVI